MDLFDRRRFGVLLHPSSLPGRDLIGTLGDEAYAFVDWLSSTGAGAWQILPLTMNGQYDSPYFSSSAFGGNPWLVDLPDLHRRGLLPAMHLHDSVTDAAVPFDDLRRIKLPQLRDAADRLLSDDDHPARADLDRMRASEHWLTDTAHFYALQDAHDGAPWFEWPRPLRRRDPDAIASSRLDLADAIARWEAVLFFFDMQWMPLKQQANRRSLTVIGDLPIYVSHDSADVWLHQDEFFLDDDGRLLVQSGVPPDYFSESGQLWGNPLYRWDVMAQRGFDWWLARLRRCLALADVVRIDHFRALSAYWEVPGDAHDARAGRWVPGPGQAFVDALRAAFPSMPFIAEDLGTLDDDVLALRDDNDVPGMRILQFGFDGTPDNPHQPHRFPENCVVYTGTHDNQTSAGWWHSLSADDRAAVAEYYQFPPDAGDGRVVWSLIEAALGSRARLAVIPQRDLLVLDDRARMNDPSVFVGNWSWRAPSDGMSVELARSLRDLAGRYGRVEAR